MRKYLDKKYNQIAIYCIMIAVAVIIAHEIIYNIPTILSSISDKIGWVVDAAKPIIVAMILTYMLNPLVDFFERKYKKVKFLKDKYCRAYAILTTLFITLAIFSAMISLIVFSITEKLRFANINDLVEIPEKYLEMVNSFYKTTLNRLKSLDIESKQVQESVTSVTTFILDKMKFGAGMFITSVSSITSFIINFIISSVLTVYFLSDGRVAFKYIKKVLAVTTNEKVFNRINEVSSDANVIFSGYIRGQIIDSLIMMFIMGTGLSIIGLDCAILIGILAGIGNVIPYVGPIIAYGSVTLVSFFTEDWKKFLIAIIFVVFVQLFDENFIRPKLLGNSIQIQPLWVMVFIVFGSAIGGMLGLILAIPVGALIKVEFTKYIDKRYENKYNKKGEKKLEEENKLEEDNLENDELKENELEESKSNNVKLKNDESKIDESKNNELKNNKSKDNKYKNNKSKKRRKK